MTFQEMRIKEKESVVLCLVGVGEGGSLTLQAEGTACVRFMWNPVISIQETFSLQPKVLPFFVQDKCFLH